MDPLFNRSLLCSTTGEQSSPKFRKFCHVDKPTINNSHLQMVNIRVPPIKVVMTWRWFMKFMALALPQKLFPLVISLTLNYVFKKNDYRLCIIYKQPIMP